MNIQALLAGWPFAGLLALGGRHTDGVLCSGVVTENDDRRGLVVRVPDGAIEVDCATPVFGVDGYPISFGDIRVGDVVQTIQEKRGSVRIATEIHPVPS
jgi:hypothetical protein